MIQNPESLPNTSSNRNWLVHALSLNAGVEFLKHFEQDAGKTSELHLTKKQQYFESLFYDIHRELFKQTHGFSKEEDGPGYIQRPLKRESCREVIHHFAQALCDANGHVKCFGMDASAGSKELAGILAKVYYALRQLQPFDYGNAEALNLFMVSIGRLPDFKIRYPGMIDFRRLDAQHAGFLADPVSTESEIREAFKQALDITRTPPLRDRPNGFQPWDDKSISIAGLRFVRHVEKDQQGRSTEYLVTVNGGLVRRDAVEAALCDHFRSDKRINRFLCTPEKYLPVMVKDEQSGELIPLQQKKVVDGFSIGADNRAPLLCLDQNIITGLRGPNHERLEKYLKSQRGQHYPIYSLRDENEARALKENAPADIKELLDIAAEHVKTVTEKLDLAKNRLLAGKTEHEHDPGYTPHLVMSMGGGGSGKSDVEKITEALCGKNYVVATLDGSREYSDIYHVLQAVGHHSDEYMVIEPLAVALREWVTKHACAHKINLFYDGTGIEYPRRYDLIVEAFKKAGFHTTVCMVDAMLTTPPERQAECPVPAMNRVVSRSGANGKTNGGIGGGRIVPWKVVVGRHSHVMRSFLQACNDENLDKVIALCNDGPPGSHYLFMETHDLDYEGMQLLLRAKQQGHLKQALIERMKQSNFSALHLLSHVNDTDQEAILRRIPAFEEANVDVMPSIVKGKQRALAVYNVHRAIDLAQKGLINPWAADPNSLYTKTDNLAFDPTPGNDGTPASVALQPVSRAYTERVREAYGQSALGK